jgi:hypothetical protein
VQDKGVFPSQLSEDMQPEGANEATVKTRAGMLPYLALAGGVLCVLIGYWLSL